LGTATDKKLTVILGQNRGFVKFLVLVSVYAIDWTWFENEGQVSKGRKKLTITLLCHYAYWLDSFLTCRIVRSVPSPLKRGGKYWTIQCVNRSILSKIKKYGQNGSSSTAITSAIGEVQQFLHYRVQERIN
jgi:hypothetical protein